MARARRACGTHRRCVRRSLASFKNSDLWREVRQRRRAERLDAIRRSVAAIGAPRRAAEEATATLLGMSGAEFSWTMHDYGLPLDRIPDTIARTVQLIVDDLRAAAAQRQQPAVG